MVGGPAQYGATALTLRCTKGDGKPGVSRCMPGAGLSLWRPGRPRLTGQPSSRTGENPPYGMSGGIEETSASCEARSAPRSYPTFRAVALRLFGPEVFACIDGCCGLIGFPRALAGAAQAAPCAWR